MEISLEQKHFNELFTLQHAPSTIRIKLNISAKYYREMLEIYIEYQKYLDSLQVASNDVNNERLSQIYDRLIELITLMRYCRDKNKYIEYEQEYENLLIIYAETDPYEPIKIQSL